MTTHPPSTPEPSPAAPDRPTLYDRVGGGVFFIQLVERFYAGVESDPVLRPLYPENLEPGKENHRAERRLGP